jgi:hypothetical protein
MRTLLIAIVPSSEGDAWPIAAHAYYPVTLNDGIQDYLVANAALDVFELYVPTEIHEHVDTRVFHQKDTGEIIELNVDLELSYSFSARDCVVEEKTAHIQTAMLNALINEQYPLEVGNK